MEHELRIARYVYQSHDSYGFVIGDTVIDHTLIAGLPATVRELLAAGLPEAQVVSSMAAKGIPLETVHLLPPVELGKVVCAGVNFPTHRAEARMEKAEEKPPYPVIFSRFPDSHVAHGDDIVRPAQSKQFDYEGELAVVIGKRAWQVSRENAANHVAGYSCYDDGSARDWQIHSQQWIPGKNFFRSGAIGPYLVTSDEVSTIGASWLTTRVNGDQRQHAQIKDMLFSIAELVEYVSAFTPLEPGDVIAAGTPGGVGLFMDPRTFLNPGDVVEVEITGVGVLRNTVAGQ